MKRIACLVFLAALVSTASVRAQKFEGLAPTPPMGWNSWNTFANNIDERLIRETADAMAANGMLAAGYNTIVIDDAWEMKERDAAGRPVVFSLCEWGNNKPWLWAKSVGHLWRTTGDVMDCYDCQSVYSQGWKVILDSQVAVLRLKPLAP